MSAKEKSSLSVDAELKISSSGEPQIQFTVHNLSNASMRVYASLLPWSRSASTVVILRSGRGKLIESQSGDPELPPAGKISLKADESISGTISLTELFPGTSKSIEEQGGMLYWSYSFDPDFKLPNKPEFYGGVVGFPAGFGSSEKAK